ncbi:MAG: lytic murein transglycosylase B [Gammaproteobacteria bacterium]
MLKGILKYVIAIVALLGALPACTTTVSVPESSGYASNPQVQAFINEMVARHGFSKQELEKVFSQAQRRDDILALMSKPAEKRLQWYDYRKIFLTRSRIEGGVVFWNKNAEILTQAEKAYGVDAQVIVAIIGVETRYGGNTGSHRVLDALSTLAFDYPPRSKFFRNELEQYLLLARADHIDLLSTKGSYAGAMGYGQFMPSSYQRYAVDFDQDGKRDLWNSPMDIVGSVANYLHEHGWDPGATVTIRASVTGNRYESVINKGLKPETPVEKLRAEGITPSKPLPNDTLVALISLDQENGPEYWLGLNNFYVITRYNHSPLYAMAVYQLSEEIRQARERMH